MRQEEVRVYRCAQAGCAFPHSPRWQRCGETRFPHVPTAVGSDWRPSRQGDGEPRVPRIFTSV